MRIDDFICLGRTVPEASTKYGVKVCMAGYSPELRQLMRVYPLPVQNPIRARHSCVMELDRNPNDSRAESWKLADREAPIQVSPKPIEADRIASMMEPLTSKSIDELNAARRSLGVLVARSYAGSFTPRKGAVNPLQGTLFDVVDQTFGAGSIDLTPYLEFDDDAGKLHRLQIREWGCYEYLRKHRHDATGLWKALGFDGSPVLLVVGNMNNQRTAWLVIKTFRLKRDAQLGLFTKASA